MIGLQIGSPTIGHSIKDRCQQFYLELRQVPGSEVQVPGSCDVGWRSIAERLQSKARPGRFVVCVEFIQVL